MAQSIRIFTCLLSAILIYWATPSARAADILLISDQDSRCTILVEGPIVEGDALSLRNALLSVQGLPRKNFEYDYTRLCLNSPGGNLREALRMVDEMGGHTSTMIGPGQECYSDCAVLFMAGRQYIENGTGYVVDRRLHPLGKLGFHSPSLASESDQYNQETVKQAYALAAQDISEMLARFYNLDFQISLLRVMLDTPPEDMFMIDTIAKAARWNIHLTGVPIPDKITKRLALNACVNAFLQTTERNIIIGNDNYATNPANVDTRATLEDDGQNIHASVIMGFNDAGGSLCEFHHSRGSNPFDLVAQEIIEAAGVVALSGGLFYPSYMTLDDLAKGATAQGHNPFDTGTSQSGTCYIFNGTDLVDQQSCTEQEDHILNDDLTRQIVQSYKWPSGATTLLVYNPGFREPGCCYTQEINGNKAEQVSWGESPLQGAECFLNTDSGNTFCFQAKQ